MIQRKRRRRDEVRVPIASMGDIAFQLIIFFMICSVFTKSTPAKLEPPKSVDIQQVPEIPSLTVTVDETGQYWVNAARVTDKDQLEQMLKDYLRVDAEGKPTVQDNRVLFKCDRQLNEQDVWLDAMEAITAAGGKIVAAGLEDNVKPKLGQPQP